MTVLKRDVLAATGQILRTSLCVCVVPRKRIARILQLRFARCVPFRPSASRVRRLSLRRPIVLCCDKQVCLFLLNERWCNLTTMSTAIMSYAVKKCSVMSPTSTLSAPSVGNDANGVSDRTPLKLPVDVQSDTLAQWIQQHYTPYDGDEGFLAPPTERTQQLNDIVQSLMKQELEKGVLDVDVSTPSGINAHEAGYIDPDLEVVVGLQTDAPLKRSIKPFGEQGMYAMDL